MMAGKTIREWFTPKQACEYVSKEIGCEVLEPDLEQKRASGELNGYLRFTKNDLNQILTEKARQVAVDKWLEENPKPKWLAENPYQSRYDEQWKKDNPELVRAFHGAAYDGIAESQGMAIEILNINFHDAGFYKITEKRLNEKSEEVYLTEIEHENRVYVLMVECDTQAQRYGYPLHELDHFIKAQIAPSSNAQTSTRPTPISDQHRKNLLQKITSNNLDPLQLTQGRGGKKGDKSRLREWLIHSTMSNSVFENTWEKAMADKVIQYKK